MTPQRLREMVDAATPGPWAWDTMPMARGGTCTRVRGNSRTVTTADPPDADLIALAPDLARLCAEQHEALAAATCHRTRDGRVYSRELGRVVCANLTGECPGCAAIAAFAALGEPASGEEGA